MTRKLPFLFNLIIAAILASILFSMYTELAGEKTIKRKPSEYVFRKVERPSAVKTEGFGKIFDVDSTASEAASDRKQGNGPGDSLNELIAGDKTLRVQGIFLTENQRFAVISIIGKKQKGSPEVIKVRAGEELKGFRVTLIEQDAVHLSGSSSQTAVLRIFSREDL